MKRRIWRTALLAIQFLAASGCGRHRSAAAPPAPEHVQGLSALTILTPGRSGEDTSDAKYQEVLPPRPIEELKGPSYPEQPLKDRYGAAVVGVRVFLDADGRVIDIEDSPVCPSTAGRYSEQFRSAVADAIRLWKFKPAEYRQYDKGKDLNGDGKPDYMVLVDSKPVPVHFDARFDFSIVKGKGLVQSRGSPRAARREP
jgi:hypothetical protein